jgi:hypothetical protein
MQVSYLPDTGAHGGNFIHPDLAREFCLQENITYTRLSRPVPVSAYNGEYAKDNIEWAIETTFKTFGHTDQKCLLFITPIGSHNIIIGFDWMVEHGVLVDTPQRALRFECRSCPVVKIIQPELKDETKKKQRPKKAKRKERKRLEEQEKQRQVKGTPFQRSTRCTLPRAEISRIAAIRFVQVAQEPGAQVFSVTLKQVEEQQRKNRHTETRADIETNLPEELRSEKDFFYKEEADNLPPHRGRTDMHIELESGAKLGHAPLYRMSHEEQELVREYLAENLKKGFIDRSVADHGSPILFVKKPGGGLRFCVDYRKLNALTKKNRYPIPLVEETLAQLSGAKIMSKIDIRHAFNRIRMATPEDEDLTTFRTSFGSYKYRVLPFGLANGPATFQEYINSVLWDCLGIYASAYLDDIMIWSQSREEHIKHLRIVIRKLREAGLYADITKCEFFVTETKFLGVIVSTEGLRMDPEKVKTIADWQRPRDNNVTDIRSFLGFCNFYRRFIKGYSRLTRSLNALTKTGVPWVWSDNCELAFNLLKEAITSAPILRHFDRKKTAFVECDASDWVYSGILSQENDEGVLHPVAFFSKKMIPAELNYEIYDKELLAIVRCFEEWRPELEGTADDLPIQVLTDHKNLAYFMDTKKLTRRQARWALTLSKYNFKIAYRPGVQNGKADALTRRPGDIPNNQDLDDRQRAMLQTLLPDERLGPGVRDSATAVVQIAPIRTAGLRDIRPEDGDEDEERLPDCLLQDYIKKAQSNDHFTKKVLECIENGDRTHPYIALAHCEVVDGVLYFNNKVYVPERARRELLQEIHEQPAIGHAGEGRTLWLIQRYYYWPNMMGYISKYIRNCTTCRRAKPNQEKHQGLLQPLAPVDRPWRQVTMDFVTGLPLCQGYNAVLMVVDTFTKERHYIPCFWGKKGTSAKATARLLLQHVWRIHGLFDFQISDRGTQFASKVFAELCDFLCIKAKMSTAWHPPTDGQSEIANKEMERYLRSFCNYQQDDWVDWLPMAEFAANANKSATTGVSPFFANKGYEPRMSFDVTTRPKEEDSQNMATKLTELWKYLQGQIAVANERMAWHANKKRKPAPRYNVGDKVYINAKNFRTARPSHKLEDKFMGPWTILRKVHENAYKIDLPEYFKVNPVFNVDLLQLDPNDPVRNQRQAPQGPIVIDGEQEWEVQQIKDSRLNRGKLEYQVDWKNQPRDDEWYKAENFNNAQDVVTAFHVKYPSKPAENVQDKEVLVPQKEVADKRPRGRPPKKKKG